MQWICNDLISITPWQRTMELGVCDCFSIHEGFVLYSWDWYLSDEWNWDYLPCEQPEKPCYQPQLHYWLSYRNLYSTVSTTVRHATRDVHSNIILSTNSSNPIRKQIWMKADFLYSRSKSKLTTHDLAIPNSRILGFRCPRSRHQTYYHPSLPESSPYYSPTTNDTLSSYDSPWRGQV